MATNEEKQPIEDRHDSESEYRSLTTDIAILTGPTLAVGAKVALDHLKDRPPKDERPEIELPPGAKK